MSPVPTADLIIALIVTWFALAGARRGFIVSAFDVGMLLVTVVVAVRGYPEAGQILARWVTWLVPLADVAGFVAILGAGELLRVIGGSITQAAVSPTLQARPILRYVNFLGGLIPGTLRGLTYVALGLLLLTSLPALSSVQGALQAAPGARAITQTARNLAPSIEGLLLAIAGGQAAAEAVPTALAPDVPFLDVGEGELDPAAAEQVLAMTNLARIQAGLVPLADDPRLAEVAQQHSLEMLQQGYLSHDSPILGSPAERLRWAGVTFRSSGENVAFAPTLAEGFQGLLASPEHRQNLLAADFTHVGIGVVRARRAGWLITQEFADEGT